MLRKGDVVVANNTRVFPARLFGAKASGGRIEVMIERLMTDNSVRAFVKASKSPKEGSVLEMDGGFGLTITGRDGDLFLLESDPSIRILDMAEAHGHIPLPPYIKREDTASDRERYQTVFAKDAGAVAAPTAGLHIDESMIEAIKQQGATWCEVTLHVGAGTFNPVRVDDLSEHQMHGEWYNISPEVCATIQKAKDEGRRVIAIGTTTMRCLEGSAAANGGAIREGSDETSIFITPGYRFNVVDVLFTNFHLPESTLLMLVSAFGGYDRMMGAYQEALREQYRFFSYGDACLITKDPEAAHAS
jgi:S-adenosylmethionine:tRNA ribosyltransferase-isomerase